MAMVFGLKCHEQTGKRNKYCLNEAVNILIADLTPLNLQNENIPHRRGPEKQA